MDVKVYKNLHNNKFSIVALDGEFCHKVIGYADALELTDVTLRVSEAGRIRVNAMKQKNVHAYVFGKLRIVQGYDERLDTIPAKLHGTALPEGIELIRYNPYLFKSFVRVDSTPELELFKNVDKADHIVLTSTMMIAKNSMESYS